MVGVHSTNLAVVVFLLVVAAHGQRQKANALALSSNKAPGKIDDGVQGIHGDTSRGRFFAFRNRFLRVYMLAVGADWLQSPFAYRLYKDTHKLPESTIAALLATTAVCGGISAPFVGSLADRFGRRLACTSYCVIQSASCLTALLSRDLRLLFLGRVLGGVSTVLLATAFETWMLAESRRLGFAGSAELSSILGEMSVAGGLVAVACGVIAEVSVNLFDSEKAPFVASVVCLVLAASLITGQWAENHGVSAGGGSKPGLPSQRAACSSPLVDPRLVAITLATCAIEGSMYVVVHSWSRALNSSRSLPSDGGNPPLGILLANFMSASALGSLCFTYIAQDGNSVQLSARAVQVVLYVAGSSLLLVSLSQQESFRFWVFCIFGWCFGLYAPSVAYLKGRIIGDEHRGRAYALMRMPLSIVVAAVLGFLRGGDDYGDHVFMVCGGLVVATAVAMGKYVRT